MEKTVKSCFNPQERISSKHFYKIYDFISKLYLNKNFWVQLLYINSSISPYRFQIGHVH